MHIGSEEEFYWSLEVNLYITPQVNAPLVIPFHQCEVNVRFLTLDTPIVFEDLKLHPPYRLSGLGAPQGIVDSHTIAHTQNELIIQGPGRANLSGNARTDEIPTELEHSAGEFQASFFPAQANNRVVIANPLVWDADAASNMDVQWTIQPGSR